MIISDTKPDRLPTARVPLSDKENPDSELTPSDRLGTEYYEPTDEEIAFVRLMRQRLTDSDTARRPHEAKCIQSLAFWGGDQWTAWNDTARKLKNTQDLSDPYRIYVTSNKLKPKVENIVVRAIQSKTTVGVKGKTRLPKDTDAARIVRGMLDHFDNLTDRPNQDLRAILGATVIGPHFTKVYFDRTIKVDVPKFNDNNEFFDTESVELGELCETICSPFEIYLDPKATSLHSGNWVIHAREVSLEYIKNKFPKRGKFVDRDSSGTGEVGSVTNRVDAVAGNLSRSGNGSADKMAVLIEMWEKPSEAYPAIEEHTDSEGNVVPGRAGGRYAFCAGDVLLHVEDWIYTELLKEGENGIFPFAELSYEPGLETPYGGNAITPAISPMQARNRSLSMIQEHLRTGPKLLYPTGIEIKPDAFKSGKPYEVIPYTRDETDPGAKPEWMVPPQLDPAAIESLNVLDADIDDIMGVNRNSNGQTAPGVTAAAAIQSLQDADRSRAALFRQQIETYRKTLATIEICIGKQAYQEPRLLAISDQSQGQLSKLGTAAGGMPQGDPAQGAPVDPMQDADGPSFDVFDFKALTLGRYILTIASSAPKTPAARATFLMDMAARGMFTPEQIPTTIVLLRAMELEESDKLTEDLLVALETMVEVQATTAANAKPDVPAMPPVPPPPTPEELAAADSAKAQAESQAKVLELEAQSRIEAEQLLAETDAKMRLAAQQHQFKMEEIELTARVKMQFAPPVETMAEAPLPAKEPEPDGVDEELASVGDEN